MRELVARGAKVINMDRQPGDELEKELGSDNFWAGPKVDVSDELQVSDALKKGLERFKGYPLRGAVNCAGYSVRGNVRPPSILVPSFADNCLRRRFRFSISTAIQCHWVSLIG